MKYPIILTLLILFSCQKQELVKPAQVLTEIVDHAPDLPKPGKGNGHGQGGNPNNPPSPTPDPTPDPQPDPDTVQQKILYVDFDGEQVNGAFGNFFAKASALTPSQQVEVMLLAQVHWSVYKITVTNNRAIYDAAPITERVKIIVTDSAIRPNGSTGVAFLNTFGTVEGVAFVHSANLYNYPKYVADIISHETGHTLGLYHQSLYDANGQLISAYRPSVMMGSPYDVPHAPWIYGPTYAYNIFQDDHAILSAILGLRNTNGRPLVFQGTFTLPETYKLR